MGPWFPRRYIKAQKKKSCNIFHILKDICRETMEKKLNHYSCTCVFVYSTEIFLLLHELICWLQHPEFALMGFSSKLHEIRYMHAEFFYFLGTWRLPCHRFGRLFWYLASILATCFIFSFHNISFVFMENYKEYG